MSDSPFIIFVTGGAGAGKSTFAESLATEIHSTRHCATNIAYVATGPKSDAEFCVKIAEHQKRRSPLFTTFEEEIEIDRVFSQVQEAHDIVLLECLATWVGNLMHRLDKEEVRNVAARKIGMIVSEKKLFPKQAAGLSGFFAAKVDSIDGLIKQAKVVSKVFMFVSNEVGLGVVPQTTQGRFFRDVLGNINRNLLRVSDAAFFLISGMAFPIK